MSGGDRIEGDTALELLAGGYAVFNLTDAGRNELTRLLQAQIRAPLSDGSKLIVALKFRFLQFLEIEDQRTQLAMMIEASIRVWLTSFRASWM